MLHSNKTLSKSAKAIDTDFSVFWNFRGPQEAREPHFLKNHIIKVLLYSNEMLCQILKAISKELSEIKDYGGPQWSLVFEEGFLHIFIEKSICIPNLVFLKLLVFSFIGGPASAAAAAVTFFRIQRFTDWNILCFSFILRCNSLFMFAYAWHKGVSSTPFCHNLNVLRKLLRFKCATKVLLWIQLCELIIYNCAIIILSWIQMCRRDTFTILS